MRRGDTQQGGRSVLCPTPAPGAWRRGWKNFPCSSSSSRSPVSKGNAAYAMSAASLPPPPTSGSAGCSEPPPSATDTSCPRRGDPRGLSSLPPALPSSPGSISPAGATEGGLKGALSCPAAVTSLQGTQIKCPHPPQEGEEGLEDGNHRLRPPAAPDMNLGQGSGVCPNLLLLLLLLHPSDTVTGQMLPLPRHQISSPSLLQGGQRNGTEKPPPKPKTTPSRSSIIPASHFTRPFP